MRFLAVGDGAFQQKCMDRILEMTREGGSILLVSHNLAVVEQIMDQVIWLDQGAVRAAGSPQEVVRAYQVHIAALSAPAVPDKLPSTVLE